MKINKLFLALATCGLLYSTRLSAQWCTFIAEPYGPSMPGITNVTLNTINRNSAALEDMNNSFINTGMSTSLVPGNTYTISITHTIDQDICPDMNIRVWIDYNQNFNFNDAGELAVTTDHHLPGTYTSTFTVPMSAKLGATQMRVTAKMSDKGGHTLPTSCNNPADPIGYHGEVENYTINMVANAGILSPAPQPSVIHPEVYPNPFNTDCILRYELNEPAPVSIEVYNLLGQNVTSLAEGVQSSGKHEYEFNPAETGNTMDIYLLRLVVGGVTYTEKLIRTK